MSLLQIVKHHLGPDVSGMWSDTPHRRVKVCDRRWVDGGFETYSGFMHNHTEHVPRGLTLSNCPLAILQRIDMVKRAILTGSAN